VKQLLPKIFGRRGFPLNVIVSSLEQFLNRLPLRSVRIEGNITDFIPEFSNVLSKTVILHGEKSIEVINEQSLNALAPIVVKLTHCEKLTEVRLVEFKNALLPIVVRLEGRVMDDIFVLF
jgi:hypothetical protein